MSNDELAKSLQCSINKQFGTGTYKVCEPLKRGSDGYVYKIQFIKDKTPGALKVLPKCLLNVAQHHTGDVQDKYKYKLDSNLCRKAKNEIRIHESLKSNFIVKLRNWSEDDLNFYMMLEYFPKGDLGNQLRKNPSGISVQRLRKIGLDLIKGIDTIHKQGVVHRDIKPHNILLGDKDQIKICDFSCAVKIAEITKTSKAGTKAYMAPEMKEAGKSYDQKADIWSYGCTLYQLMTGKLAFKGSNYSQEYSNIQFEALPKPLANLLKKIWRVDPSNRLTPAEIINHSFYTGASCEDQQQFGDQFKSNPVPNLDRNKKSQSVEVLSKNGALEKWRAGQLLQNKDKAKSHRKRLEEQEINKYIKKQALTLDTDKENRAQASNLLHLPENRKTAPLDELLKQKLKSSHVQIEKSIRKLSPLNLRGLGHGTVRHEEEIITISDEGFSRFFTSGKQILISPDGNIIKITHEDKSKLYELDKLPEKYTVIYERTKEMVRMLQSQSKRSSSRAKNGSDSRRESRRKGSESSKVRHLQSNYVSPHFGAEHSSLQSSKCSNEDSTLIQCLPICSQILLDIKLENQHLADKSISLSLCFDHQTQQMRLGTQQIIRVHEDCQIKKQKLHKILSARLGRDQGKYISNKDLSNILKVVDDYYQWFTRAPKQRSHP